MTTNRTIHVIAALLAVAVLSAASGCGGIEDETNTPRVDLGPGNLVPPAFSDDATPGADQGAGPLVGGALNCRPFKLASGKTICLPQKRLFEPGNAAPPPPNYGTYKLPAKVDGFPGTVCTSVHDQGTYGWCVGHSLLAAMEAIYCKEHKAEQLLSVPHLWYAMGRSVCDKSGSTLSPAFAAAAANYIVTDKVWPFTESCATMAASKPSFNDLQVNGRAKIKGSAAVAKASVQGLKTALAQGYYVVYGVPVFWTLGWGNGCSKARWKNGDIDWIAPAATVPLCTKSTPVCYPPQNKDDLAKCRCSSKADCPYGGDCVGGRCVDGYHAILITGYTDAGGGWFTFKNSWGAKWGNKGFGRLSYAYISSLGHGGLYPTGLLVKGKCAQPVCAVGDTKCTAGASWTCKADACGWDKAKACACGCDGKACKAPSCTPGALRCAGKTVEQCSSAGCGWAAVKTCSCGCASGACNAQSCAPNLTKCAADNKSVLSCDVSGCGFTTKANCACGCAGGACKAKACQAGQAKCVSGGKVQKCNASGCAWQAPQACACGCSGGACKAKVCTPGQKLCSPDDKSVLLCNSSGCGYTKISACACGCSGGVCKGKVCSPNSSKCVGGNKVEKCSSSGCGYTTSTCGGNTCGAWSAWYTSGAKLERKRTCTTRGCSFGACFKSNKVQVETKADPTVVNHNSQVFIKTRTKMCLTAPYGSNCLKVHGNCSPWPNSDELFRVVKPGGSGPLQHGDAVFIKTYAGLCLTSAHGKGCVCPNKSKNCSPWHDSDELFTVVRKAGAGWLRSGDKVFFKTREGYFFNSPYSTQPVCTKSTAHPVWGVSDELFEVIKKS